MKTVEKEHGFFWHWQNLKKEDNTKQWLNGRAWLHRRRGGVLGVQWVIPSGRFHIKFTADSCEGKLCFSFALWLFALYFSFEHWKLLHKMFFPNYQEREIGLSWFMQGLHWRIWADPTGWSKKTPKWRDGSFYPLDFLLGRRKHSSVNQGSKDIVIDLPEASYPAVLTFSTSTWKRPRWHWSKRVEYAEIEVEGGVPIPGKGENSWDCGEDAIFSLSTPDKGEQEAIAHFIERVNERRLRYGGKNWKPEKATV